MRLYLPPAPSSFLVNSELHLKERETGIKDLAAPIWGFLGQVLGHWSLLLPSGAKLVNLDPPIFIAILF